jgi:hypothetical protein
VALATFGWGWHREQFSSANAAALFGLGLSGPDVRAGLDARAGQE